MIGRRVVREALDRGHHVTVVARDPSKVGERDQQLDLVQGDVFERDQIAAAVEGQDVVVSAVGSAREATPTPRSISAQPSRASVRYGARGRCNTSRRRRRRSEHVGRKAALDFYRTVSDVRWTYVSPPSRIEPGERSGTYRVGVDELLVGADDVSAISMEDYAVALVDEIETPRHVGRRFTVGY
jgi:putative NADH-flavin reductase